MDTDSILERSWKALLDSGTIITKNNDPLPKDDEANVKLIYLMGMLDLSKLLFWHCEEHDITRKLTPDRIVHHIRQCQDNI